MTTTEIMQKAVAVGVLAIRLRVSQAEALRIYDESTARLSACQELRANKNKLQTNSKPLQTAV